VSILLNASLLVTHDAARAREAIKKPRRIFPFTDFRKDGPRRVDIVLVTFNVN
jgi:hypothetical protein